MRYSKEFESSFPLTPLRAFKKRRKFNGKIYTLHIIIRKKSYANGEKKYLQHKGYSVRILSHKASHRLSSSKVLRGKVYGVYKRRKKN